MTKNLSLRIGSRDLEILQALDRCPLTPEQLLRLSQSFQQPFTDAHNVRRRLRELSEAELIRSFVYAMANDGRSPRYYKLTRDGYRFLYGADATLPRRRYFEAIRPGHHHHSFCLAEVVVHLCVTAAKHDCDVLHFARENSVKLQADAFTLFPDAAFVVRRSDGKTFPFVVELDNGTERVRSKQDVESIERKIRGYDIHQGKFDKFDPDRYLVLFVTTRSRDRLQHILSTAASIVSQPQRTVFVGTELKEFLSVDPFVQSALQDHRGLRRQIIPMAALEKAVQSHVSKTGAFAKEMQGTVIR